MIGPMPDANAVRYFQDKLAYQTSPREVVAAQKAGDKMTVVDVRRAEAFAKGHIPGSVNLVLNQLSDARGKLDPARLVTRQVAAGSVIAATAVRTLFLPVAAFERLIELEPRHLRPFACLLGERFAVAYRYIAEEQVLSPAERLLSRLRGIVAIQRRDPADRQPMTISMSQAELANMLGLSRQTLNALLAGLQSRGLIEVGYKRVRVLAQA